MTTERGRGWLLPNTAASQTQAEQCSSANAPVQSGCAACAVVLANKRNLTGNSSQ
ncbi:hypothetical protein RB1072 [Rhodopirellula baltica SH 1]|uniref:Uncharacterized protein n=1 Tax=Rhodopirellula baltica (strain DSM 10527 / NCIMB 13988 / SH1) TaxID=243090 RepID=Q7UXW0_RHOBA|nr:hypothetical protein RB1072 [Rhodopirellula baltica SH 1]